ncbi:hypothetical protein EWM64_g6532 [Hericium alpestre]|uniref:Uncharacterized protein n=1 Tax=Hericium alpestre TaxID=135208 RepID=A0A4Y9ZRR4_9AGAM|nr:hypothetical protein EWM64_g6532 [Hericium alpestre]
MGLTWPEFLENNKRPLPPLEDRDISGRTVIVTGANTGIGYEIAKYMAKFGASKVIAACRNEAKGHDAIARIAKETGRDSGTLECWPLDFASMSSVRRFAQRYNKSGLPLHIFVHNAGMNGIGKIISEDGFDMMLQVNYLAPALLSMLLYPVLAGTGALDKAHPARFLWVMSEGSAVIPFDEPLDAHPIEALNKKFYELVDNRESEDSRLQYFAAKLACLLACHEYARRIPASANIAVATAAPGLVATELGQKDVNGNNLHLIDLEPVFTIRPRTPEEGARTIVLAATYPVEEVWKAGTRHVPFFTNMQEMDTEYFVAKSGDPELRRKVWDDTVRVLKLTDDEVDICFL